MRSLLLASLFGATLVAVPAHAELEGQIRAESLLEAYAEAMATCDIAAFDELHADNLVGKGPGGTPITHVGLQEQCAEGAPDAVDFKMNDYEISDGLLLVSADMLLTETADDGNTVQLPFYLSLTSRLTANGDDQVIVSEVRFLEPL